VRSIILIYALMYLNKTEEQSLSDLLSKGVEDKNRRSVKVLTKVVRDVVNRYSYDKEHLDDVCGECICCVLKKRKTYNPRRSKPSTWIWGVVKRHLFNENRKVMNHIKLLEKKREEVKAGGLNYYDGLKDSKLSLLWLFFRNYESGIFDKKGNFLAYDFLKEYDDAADLLRRIRERAFIHFEDRTLRLLQGMSVEELTAVILKSEHLTTDQVACVLGKHRSVSEVTLQEHNKVKNMLQNIRSRI